MAHRAVKPTTRGRGDVRFQQLEQAAWAMGGGQTHRQSSESTQSPRRTDHTAGSEGRGHSSHRRATRSQRLQREARKGGDGGGGLGRASTVIMRPSSVKPCEPRPWAKLSGRIAAELFVMVTTPAA